MTVFRTLVSVKLVSFILWVDQAGLFPLCPSLFPPCVQRRCVLGFPRVSPFVKPPMVSALAPTIFLSTNNVLELWTCTAVEGNS